MSSIADMYDQSKNYARLELTQDIINYMAHLRGVIPNGKALSNLLNDLTVKGLQYRVDSPDHPRQSDCEKGCIGSGSMNSDYCKNKPSGVEVGCNELIWMLHHQFNISPPISLLESPPNPASVDSDQCCAGEIVDFDFLSNDMDFVSSIQELQDNTAEEQRRLEEIKQKIANVSERIENFSNNIQKLEKYRSDFEKLQKQVSTLRSESYDLKQECCKQMVLAGESDECAICVNGEGWLCLM